LSDQGPQKLAPLRMNALLKFVYLRISVSANGVCTINKIKHMK